MLYYIRHRNLFSTHEYTNQLIIHLSSRLSCMIYFKIRFKGRKQSMGIMIQYLDEVNLIQYYSNQLKLEVVLNL
jgi:hypothetical protein